MKTIKAKSTAASLTLYNQSYQSVSDYDSEADFINAIHSDGGRLIKSFQYGKCQYKTGKCFNERTVKRNGEAHSLCEEHRLKQNLIQRRSDRKYQTVHAVRRRERSQRRAVLKKQVSMAVAQRLYYEHQQQKTMSLPSPHHSPLHLLTATSNDLALLTSVANQRVGLAPPIQVPSPVFMSSGHRELTPSLVLSVQPQHSGVEGVNKKRGFALDDDELSPTGIDDFTSNMFLTIGGDLDMPILSDEEFDENFMYTPLVSGVGHEEVWSDDEIELLQTILLS